MTKNIDRVSLKKSKRTTEGLPNLPLPEQLVEGELAINYAKDVETISLKNESGTVVTFSSDNYYTEKKLGSGFTGDNSANTVTSVIESNERVISSSLNDLETRKLDASAYTPTDLSNYYTKTEVDERDLWVSGTGLNSVVLKGSSGTASGDYSVAEGKKTIASGDYAVAEGNSTVASGSSSHAEGGGTQANGIYSHAEGGGTQANGQASHAEGGGTKANGSSSHAEGGYTTASGDMSHAEGGGTQASGAQSHAEGSGTIANGNYSHAEGVSTIASGESSHAEGGYTTASGSSSHAEGSSTKANGDSSHAEGYSTTASGMSSHAEGIRTTASGNYSHAEGNSTKASGDSSHAEGDNTKASGNYSHAEGYSTTASGYSSHAEGYSTIANGSHSHAEGWGTKADGNYSHAESYQTSASGHGSHAEGFMTQSNGDYSHAEGQSTKANGAQSHAEGYSTKASGNFSHTEGVSTIANNDSEHASGQFNVSNSATTTFGDSGNTLFSVGNGTANNARHNAFEIRQNGDIYVNDGTNDVRLQDYLVTPVELWESGTGLNSVVLKGSSGTAIGGYAVAEGYQTSANAHISHAEGWGTITNNISEHASGQFNVSSKDDEGEVMVFGSSGSTLFSVGNGTNDNNRHNAFEIRQNGDIYIVSGNSDIRLQDYIGGGGSITVDQDFSNTASTNPISTKAVYSAVTDNELVWTNAFVVISGAISSHTEDTSIHVTSTDRTNWNAKLDASAYTPTDLSDYYTKSETSGKTEISNALQGKVNSATFTAHTADTTIHLTSGDVKTQIDDRLGSGFTGANSVNTVTSVIESNERVISSSLNELNSRKLDASAYTPTDLSNYYTKAEVDIRDLWVSGTGLNAIVQKGTSGVASGDYAITEGYQTSALTSYSHAEGSETIASGQSSHAEGYNAVAIGQYSHAEGYSHAIGIASHAEGGGAAFGGGSHAEGTSAASGETSHAEGYQTIANGDYSHTEGNETQANGLGSHAEGAGTQASGSYSHAEGSSTKANGGASHAEGIFTVTNNQGEHASGNYNISLSASVVDYEEIFGESGSTLFSVGNGAYINHTEYRHNAIEIKENGDIYIANTNSTASANYYEKPMIKLQDAIDLTNYYTKSETSGATEISTALSGKSDTGHTHDDRYYTEAEIDNLVGSGFTSSSITEVIIENEQIVSSSLNDLDERKLDASAYTPTDLSDYYTKSETSGATEISNALDNKVDNTEYATFSAATNASISDLSGQSETVAAALNYLNDNKLDASAYTPTDLSNYYTKSETSGKTEISNALSNKADKTAVDDLSGQSETIAAALNYLNDNKLDASAYTPTDLSNYYTSAQTEAAIASAFNDKYSVISAVTVNSDLINVTCPASITGSSNNGAQAVVIYENEGSTTDYNVSISTSYKTPSGSQITLTCPKNGYCEISYININGTIYARGI